MSRRGFLATSAVVFGAQGMASAAGGAGRTKELAREPRSTMEGPFTLPPLPYAEDALDPHISAKTMGFHYGKHHKGYVEKLNKAVEGKKLAEMKLEEVIVESAKDPSMSAVFNSAAQTWNHTFYWQSMKPKGGGEPSGKLADKIKSDLGGMEGFKKSFAEAANGQFGSGWAWLTADRGTVAIESTPNQDSPLMSGKTPILGCDVWEHAYYLKYQNRRPDYVAAWWNVVNWTEVGKRFAAAQSLATARK